MYLLICRVLQYLKNTILYKCIKVYLAPCIVSKTAHAQRSDVSVVSDSRAVRVCLK